MGFSVLAIAKNCKDACRCFLLTVRGRRWASYLDALGVDLLPLLVPAHPGFGVTGRLAHEGDHAPGYADLVDGNFREPRWCWRKAERERERERERGREGERERAREREREREGERGR